MSAVVNELIRVIIGDLIFVIGCALLLVPIVFPKPKPKFLQFVTVYFGAFLTHIGTLFW